MAHFVDHPNLSLEQRNVLMMNAIVETHFEANAAQVRAAEAAEAKRLKDIETARINAELDARRKREREAEKLKQKKRSVELFEADLKRRFFAANPAATESDFDRAKQSLKDQHFAEQMRKTETTETLFRKTMVRM